MYSFQERLQCKEYVGRDNISSKFVPHGFTSPEEVYNELYVKPIIKAEEARKAAQAEAEAYAKLTDEQKKALKDKEEEEKKAAEKVIEDCQKKAAEDAKKKADEAKKTEEAKNTEEAKKVDEQVKDTEKDGKDGDKKDNSEDE